ncbi:MAG: PspC domain-containing protein, partial [Sphingomonadaceae bacterium]|nr:PspC domain-containing protein [Sphingomonadaceae bacterium]
MTRLTLDKANKKILGVCAGLANWTGMDAMIIRL